MSSVFQKNEPLTYDLSQISVLLVEDSIPMQTLISSMLRSFGVGNILACSGADEAIGLLKVTQARKRSVDISSIDIVITDWLMPEGSGVELIDWIRSQGDESICFLPIILLSAYTTQEVISIARDRGANEAMVKPVSGGGLARRILDTIDRPRPFVRAGEFFGPDRRRREIEFSGENRRTTAAEKIKVNHERV